MYVLRPPGTGTVVPGRRYSAAVSVGTNPTFSGRTRTVEAYVLDTTADLYGQHVAVDFVSRIRGQRKFASVDDLIAARRADLKQAALHTPYWSDERASVTLLPDAPWSRRVIGCLANQLARAQPHMAHAVLKQRSHGGYVASVRAPLASPHGAHALCQRFSGSGRAAAAGIDHLPFHELHRFVGEFSAHSWGAP